MDDGNSLQEQLAWQQKSDEENRARRGVALGLSQSLSSEVQAEQLREQGTSPIGEQEQLRRSLGYGNKPTPDADDTYDACFTVGECPRVPYAGESLTGKVCVGSTGRVGVVSGYAKHHWGMAWVGFGVDGQGPWSSKAPIIIAEDLEAYRSVMAYRFPSKHVHYEAVARELEELKGVLTALQESVTNIRLNSDESD